MKLIPYRRKREGRTNYKKRLILLKSRKPRLVIRRTNQNVIVQIAEYSSNGDKILCSAHSKELKKLGWQYSTKSIPAAYLTGTLLYSKMKTKKINTTTDIIVDIGVHTPIKGSRIYAVIKGLKDCGIKIPSSDEIFPSQERLKGEHIVNYCKNKPKNMFTKYNIDKFSSTFEELSEKLKS